MKDKEQRPERRSLGFEQAVGAELTFLRDEPFDFEVTRSTPLLVQFSSPAVELVVFHDRLSYELGVLVWRRSETDEGERPYTMSDLIRVSDVAAAANYRRYTATTEGAVRRGIRKIAKDLRTFGNVALLGYAEYYAKLDRVRRRAIEAYGARLVAEQARAAADRAWARSEFPRVVEAYEPIENELTASEQARLRYARERSVS